MNDTNPQGESAAEREGIVDQQDAALEKLDDEGTAADEAPEGGPNVGPTEDDPMEGEAPTG